MMRLLLTALTTALLAFGVATPLDMPREFDPPTEKKEVIDTMPQKNYEEGTLICMVEDEQAAADIAALYSIELVSVENGLAIFYTDRDAREVINEGIENGWPMLELNRIHQLH